jgi:hypothetical protein
MAKYNLSSSQADRINYDEDVRRFAYDCASESEIKFLTNQITEAYWQQYSNNLDTDDFKEAEARFKIQFLEGWKSYFYTNIEEKREYINEYLSKNGFDLDQIDACYWSESQCDEFLENQEKGIEEAKLYIKSL